MYLRKTLCRAFLIFILGGSTLVGCISSSEKYPVHFAPLAPEKNISGQYRNRAIGNTSQPRSLYEYFLNLFHQIGQDGRGKNGIVSEAFLKKHVRDSGNIVHITQGSGKVTISLKKEGNEAHSISLKYSFSANGAPVIHSTFIQHGELVTHTVNLLLRDSSGALIIKAIHTSKGHCFCLPVVTIPSKQISWFRWESAE